MSVQTAKETIKILPIVKYGDPVLERKAKPVTQFDEALKKTIRSMFATMYAEPGIGLAAPQVGIGSRLLVVDVAPQGKSRPMVLVNPVILEKKGRAAAEEGCLSFPGIVVRVTRPEWVRVSALNENGLPVEIASDGLLARCIQHEMDHIDGKLMIDHVPLPKRWAVYWEIRKRKKAGLW